MASISGICLSSPTLKFQKHPSPSLANLLHRRVTAFPTRPKLASAARSLARDTPAADLSSAATVKPGSKSGGGRGGLEKEPRALWRRYVEWLYQHKELGLYLDVSRVGFTDEFVREMEPRLQKAFGDMEELEKGAIANPDEGRMVGHYWLRDSNRAPNSFIKGQIDKTLHAVCEFANDVVTGKVSFTVPQFIV